MSTLYRALEDGEPILEGDGFFDNYGQWVATGFAGYRAAYSGYTRRFFRPVPDMTEAAEGLMKTIQRVILEVSLMHGPECSPLDCKCWIGDAKSAIKQYDETRA